MDEKIIIERFNEWTSRLEPKQAMISVFEHIRDIPYAIVPAFRDPAFGPVGILEQNEGSCQPKHYLLMMFFHSLKIPVKLATYAFRWSDSDVRYPHDLKELISRLPIEYHLACKAEIEGRWVLVDATWDMPLINVGFPVNEYWDGISNTKNAVTPIEEVMHESVRERVRFETERHGLYTEEEKAVYREFIEKLNAWLEAVRGGHYNEG